MSSAISGMRNHQLMLDVVGNDIANVSTAGYKSAGVVFSDVLSQTLAAGDPAGINGGTNPVQVGLGSRLSATTQSFTQGALQRTGRISDMALEGTGFFVLNNGTEQVYTRAGAFSKDADGNLVAPNGSFVMGWQADAAGNIDTNQAITSVKIPIGATVPPRQTTNANIAGTLSASAAVGTVVTNSTTFYTAQGAPVLLNVTYTKSAANQWTLTAGYGNPSTAVPVTQGVLTFDANGELTAPADRDANIAAGAIPGITGAITLSFGAAGAASRLTQYGSTSTVTVTSQDGSQAGVLQEYDISNGGTISGRYSNGTTLALGRIAVAQFANEQGLERIGGGWRETASSGIAQIGQATQGGRGNISAGTLESSNVDLAEEFSSLILAQRGFQGNARVITAADEVLQEVVRLGR
jgi:flagellar hook protein FlgE